MAFYRFLWLVPFLVLQICLGAVVEKKSPPVASEDLTSYFDALIEKVRPRFTKLLSIPPEEQTFENFYLPWCRIKSEIYFHAYEIKETSGNFFPTSAFLKAMIVKIDPNNTLLFLTTLKSFLTRTLDSDSLDQYQKYLLDRELFRMFAEPYNRCDEFFCFSLPTDDEDFFPPKKASSPRVQEFSLLNCTLQNPPNYPASIEEIISDINATNADIVCVQGIRQDELGYSLFEGLKSYYHDFYVEENPETLTSTGITLIASKYDIEYGREGYLSSCYDEEDNEDSHLEWRYFFNIMIKDKETEIGHIYVTRLNPKFTSVISSALTRRVVDKMHLEFASHPVPTLLCGNFCPVKNLSLPMGQLIDAYFQNDEQCGNSCTLLLKTFPSFSQRVITLPFVSDQQGVLSIVSTSDSWPINSFLERKLPDGALLASHGSASASAGSDSHGNSHAETGVKISSDDNKWSAGISAGVSRDNEGHTSGHAEVRATVDF